MPLAMIVGRGEQRLVEAAGLMNLPERQVILPEGPLHVHFDTDVTNPMDAPAQNYLAQGGP